METAGKLNRLMGRNMPWFLLGSVIIGVCFAEVFTPLQPYLGHMLAVVTFANSLGGGFRDLGEVLRRPLPVAVTFVVMHLIMPALVLGVGRVVFPNNPDFVSGLVLQFTLPVGVSSLMWVSMSGGHVGLCLSMVLLDTLLAPFTIPLTLQVLLGTAVEMDLLSMMRDLLLMVGIPALLAMLLHRKRDGSLAKDLKEMLMLPSKLIILLTVATTSSKCAHFFLNLDPWLLAVIVTILALSAGGFVVGHWVSGRMKLDYPTAFTLTVIMGFRNISAGIVLAQQYFPAAAVLPVSVMPLFQQLLLSVVVKVLWRTRPARAYAAGPENEGQKQP